MFVKQKSDPFVSPFMKSFISGSGEEVTYETALQDPTVNACIRIISNTISTLPLKLYKQQQGSLGKEWQEDLASQMAYILTCRPNPRQTSTEFIEQMVAQLCLYSEFYAMVDYTNAGKVLRITPFNSPKQVSVIEHGDGLRYDCITNEGKGVVLNEDQIFVVRDLTLNTFKALDKILLAKSTIGLSLSATHNAESYYKVGSRSGGFIKVDGVLSDESYARLARQVNDAYAGKDNAHKIGILEGNSSYVENTYSLKDAQVLESRNASIREIATLFGVPIPLLGIPDNNFKDVESINSFFYKSRLQSLITKIEARFRLILPSGYALKFDTSDYLRGDAKTNAEVAELLFTRGVIGRNETRKRLGMQADTSEDLYVVASNNLVFGTISDFTKTIGEVTNEE
ncbi:phage portal protein [Shewanella oncorhynchi]|uniref:Phage portal protein n=1 Tax=Shewanella oncorhynchi TaxID=2726434 RepID=A0AA50Q7W4_9GAMM|nr:phage portal protein [Shewanella oncorhynchi]WMB74215.1 phage portal protein [Shewanella oncorhynchi]